MQREADERARDQATQLAARTQLAVLRAHLRKLGVRDLDPDEFAEQAQGNWWTNPDTAELCTWFVIDGSAYYEKDGVIYVEREARGRLEWTILGADGKPVGPWQLTAPPRARSAFN
jgi:hypothetical protein